jgi:non-ribosomal peptide synthetase component F
MPPLTSQLNELKNAGNAASVPAELPFAKLVVTWLAGRADTTPDAIAVVSEKETLTYGELDQRANQLAHHLQSLGVGPEVITTMCLDRSVAAVIAALAVLKAGGAYLPLDPGSPADRLAFILKDAQPAVVITQSQYVAKVVSGSWRVVNVDDISAETWNGSYGRPNVDITPDNLA